MFKDFQLFYIPTVDMLVVNHGHGFLSEMIKSNKLVRSASFPSLLPKLYIHFSNMSHQLPISIQGILVFTALCN